MRYVNIFCLLQNQEDLQTLKKQMSSVEMEVLSDIDGASIVYQDEYQVLVRRDICQ